MALVNKAELADLIRCSLPTLGKLIKRYPDMPVERRGRNGEQWQFNADAVIAFLEAKRADAAEQANARADLLDQFRLPIDDQSAPEDRGLTPTQQLAAVKTRMLLAKEAREAGMLVPVSDVRMVLNTAVSGLAQAHDGFTNRIGRRHNLPRAVMDEIAKDLSETRTAFVRALGPFTPADARA